MNARLFALAAAFAALTAAAATPQEDAVRHRRAAREAMSAGGADAIERFLHDADPGVRRYALARLFESDAAKGKAASVQALDDPDDAVKALARELTRERKPGRRAASPLPLSQDPANDHEVIRLKSIAAEGESFVMPAKMACDEVEIWFGETKQHLLVWVNDVLAAEYDPAVDGARDFRFDATKVVKWGSENKMWVTDERGKDKWLKFSVEVIKCGQ